MINPLAEAAARVLQYPSKPLQRRHGPHGYADYRHYKPWLRDDFGFRCVYCLCRERWEPNGHYAFSVDHVAPQVTHPERACDYDNLLYACSICNACRQERPLPVDPCSESMAAHLRTLEGGVVEALTRQGYELCDLCHLNRPLLVDFRRGLLRLIRLLGQRQTPEHERGLQQILGFPDDLPDLQRRRPPGKNRRPDGISTSWFEKQRRGQLPLGY